MMKPRPTKCLLVAASFCCAAGQDVFHAGPVYSSITVFPEVRVLVTPPPSAKPGSLTPGTFSLKVDNGAPSAATAVQTLADTGLGMAALIMLDASGSMAGGPLNAIRAGLIRFTSEATLVDRVAICTVADETRFDSNWNDNSDQLKAALAGLKSRGSLTRLWDGMLDAVAKYPESPLARRLIVISDGHDEGSQHTLNDVIAAANLQHVVVDSIGMTRGDPKYLANLARLSNATGGVHRDAPSLTVLEQLVGGGIKRYRTLPVVTFRAEGIPADGKLHAFVVNWTGGGGEFQALTVAPVPEDPKPPVVTPPLETPKKTEGPALSTPPMAWLYAGGGALAALALGLIAMFTLRDRKPAASLPPPQVAFQEVPPVPIDTNIFPQPSPPPPPPPALPQPQGSVYMPLLDDPRPPSHPPTWFHMPTKLAPAAWLVAIEGPVAGKSFPVDDANFWIGANPNNQLTLTGDATVSGNHACIVFDNDSLGLFDHRSTNGLYLNDQRVTDERIVLRPGDKLRVGRSIFVLRRPDDPS